MMGMIETCNMPIMCGPQTTSQFLSNCPQVGAVVVAGVTVATSRPLSGRLVLGGACLGAGLGVLAHVATASRDPSA